MRIARWFIFGFPTLLILLVCLSFWNETQLSQDRKNEMTLGLMGEPASLNPIQQADSASSEVASSLFNGLLKFSPDLEIIGDLAQTWMLDQTTTLFCRDAATAEKTSDQLLAWRSEWAGWTLEKADADGRTVLLKFREPGLVTSKEIVSRLPVDDLTPLAHLRIEVKEGSRETLKKLRAAFPASFIVREWIESGGAFEITADPALTPEIEKWLSANAGGTIKELEKVTFLAEPQVTFKLRSDVKWHDGAPLTSRDVSFTYEAIMDDATASPRKPDFDLIQSIQTPDPQTAIVTYRKPYSPALESWMMSILPSHLLEGKPQSWWAENFNRRPVGTGPFLFDQWKTTSSSS